MFLLVVKAREVSYGIKELPAPNLKVDPRPIFDLDEYDDGGDALHKEMSFTITYIRYHNNNHDKFSIAIGRTDGIESGWKGMDLKFRVYDPSKELVPRFDTTTYKYLGVAGEHAPYNTVNTFIDPSVRIIQEYAFRGCNKMEGCIIHDDVEEIGECVFEYCHAMVTIRLPRNLKRIGKGAFHCCDSLDALFIPPSVEEIGQKAFEECTKMKVLSLPPDITLEQMHSQMLYGCTTFFETTHIQPYSVSGYRLITIDPDGFNYQRQQRITHITRSEIIHQAIIDFFRNNTPPLHKACLDTNVTSLSIHDCIRHNFASEVEDRSETLSSASSSTLTATIARAASTTDHNAMTPLHILAINPYVCAGSGSSPILACLHLNMNVAFMADESGMTPLDYMKRYNNVNGIVTVIQALCIHQEASIRSHSLSDSRDEDGTHNRESKRKRVN